MMQITYDLTYDKSYLRSNDIYILNTSKWGSSINQDIPEMFKLKFPEVEKMGLYSASAFGGEPFFPVEDGMEKGMVQTAFVKVTPDFMDIFQPEIIKGNTTDVFRVAGKGIISEKTARKMFGDKDPLGQIVQSFMFPENKVIISAIYRDFPENSSLLNGIYTHLEKTPDTEWNYYAYFLVNSKNINKLNTKINSDQTLKEVAYSLDSKDEIISFTLSNLNKKYLYGDATSETKVINTTLSLLSIGVIILIISFINFFNFTVSMAPLRMKSMGVRMIYGANVTQLKYMLAMHPVFLSIISIFFSLVLVRLLALSPIASLFDIQFDLSGQLTPIVFSFAIILLFSFAVGWYGAGYSISGGQTFASSSNNSVLHSSILRNTLIIFQFIAAIILISISVFIKIQHTYMKTHSLGFDKENIITFYTHGLNVAYDIFGQELLENPHVIGYAASQGTPGQLETQWGRTFKGKHLDSFHVWPVDCNFMKIMNIKLISGDYPIIELIHSRKEGIYPNEAFMKRYDFNENMVDENDGNMHIMGFVENINFQSLHVPVQPMVLWVTDEKWRLHTFFVKLAPGDEASTIESIRQKWDKHSTMIPFTYKFLDEQIDNLYTREKNMSQLIGLFGLLTILISIMGIYGMILLTIRSKVKNIGIRKINGASVSEIVIMLNKTLFLLLGLAFMIAVPFALYIIYKWLENFAYRAAIPWWLFPSTLLLVVIISGIVVSWESIKAAKVNPVDAIKME